jgi:hypothetical protein
MTMMEDGVKACQNGATGPKVMDVAELLWDSVEDGKAP